MFNAADILVHAHPMIDRFMAEGCLIVMGIGVTQIVPARADEGIHRIQFTRCRAAAFRAGAVHEGFARSKRALGAGRKLDICRQFYRQILFRDEDFAALRAIDDRNGCAPIALTADQPVAEAVIDAPFAQALFFHVVHDGSHGFMHFHTREGTGINEDTVLFRIGVVHFLKLQFMILWLEGKDLLDTVF